MDFVIVPGALCLLMSMDKMAAVEWMPGVGVDISSRIGRESIR